MLNLTLLGSGGGMPMPNRYLSALLINYMGRKILIDCGEGTQVAMRKMNTGFKNIDIICISHFHGDHIYGLPGLLSTMGNSGRTKPVTIIGPCGLKKVIEAFFYVISYLPYKIEIIEDPKTAINIIDGIEISTLNLIHSSPCIGYSFYVKRKPEFLPEKAKANNVPREIWKRLQNEETVELDSKVYSPNMVLGKERRGIKLSFITDTRPFDGIISFVKESDLFVCESTYLEEDDQIKAIQNQHMTCKEATRLASNAKVVELLLTHFSSAIDQPHAKGNYIKSFFSDTIIGFDGWNKSLTYKD